ncbi:hypothetical protein DYBT9275_04338 [Dyadobacter sp. CECT 9275]|uniref:Nuclear transport factor 2 family protein n=2 Tax=Dyadobacter helix TaxID=2822344 RepID=A0A916JF68_9BACT|nr:hypothetical protein DYBT9275_04338 [Dyadobacter sp. CECT 9275]
MKVRSVVDRLFAAMQEGDSAKAHAVFSDHAQLTSLSYDKKDSLIISTHPVSGFIKAIGTPHQEKWIEKIYNVSISVDGPMATVWAPYKFYLDDRYLHCGVNAIQLLKTMAGWKITEITDTRRKENCPD